MKLRLILLSLFLTSWTGTSQESPLRVGVAGLTHGHVHWILGAEERGDIEIVGISEPDRELAGRFAAQYGFDMDLVYPDLETMIRARQPEAVTAFGDIHSHLEVVQACAPQGIHVMVEKPLAVNLDHARQMAQLAGEHNIHLLTNYETSWYPTNHKAYALTRNDSAVGDIRKIMVRDGHRGPVKIGVQPEFLGWLTDPEKNGGGAITDFGCYGANLITWLLDGEKPLSVTALTMQLQAENNPKVDDEAIILLEYEHAVGVIQASWNWPIGRKDMEIYGLRGALFADNRNDLRIRMAEGYDGFDETLLRPEALEAPLDDPFAYLKAVVRGTLTLPEFEPGTLANNLLVMEILDAAVRSAREGRKVILEE